MPHNDTYLDIVSFGDGGSTIDLPMHDKEALHDEDGIVKENNLANGAVTADKLAENAVGTAALAEGAVTLDKLSDDVKDSWDSQSLSVEPQRIGAWIDGRPIMRRVIHYVGLPANGSSVPFAYSLLLRHHVVTSVSTSIPYWDGNSYSYVCIDPKHVYRIYNKLDFTGCDCWIIFEYVE